MNARVLTRKEQRLLMRGLAMVREQASDRLYGQIHPSDGIRLVLLNINDVPQEGEEPE